MMRELEPVGELGRPESHPARQRRARAFQMLPPRRRGGGGSRPSAAGCIDVGAFRNGGMATAWRS
eukprot:141993-Alexandrium_andersonii.AAC.1